jgi:hypothetical protein
MTNETNAATVLADDVQTALMILAGEGAEDSPLAAFLRAALRKFYGEVEPK